MLAQTVSPAEIIVIDDGSSDGSAERVRSMCQDHPQIIFWSWPNQGAHHTLNAAIHRATGEFVAVLNSDDSYHPERLAHCLDAMQANPAADAVASEISFIDEAGRPKASQWYEDALAFYRETRDWPLALCRANFLMTTSNLFIRRSAFESVGYFLPLRYAHDLEFFLRLILEQKRIHLLPRSLLTYRFHAGNTIMESQACHRCGARRGGGDSFSIAPGCARERATSGIPACTGSWRSWAGGHGGSGRVFSRLASW